MKIQSIHAREVLDSRGNPTVEADVVLDDGTLGRAISPSGASTGSHEAHELRDGDPKRYGGKGVQKTVNSVNTEIAAALTGKDPMDQEAIDETMIKLDGTENKERLGANGILAVSLAVAHAAANASKTPLFMHVAKLSKHPRDPIMPVPMCNVINGGAHTSWESTDIQEFMIAPVGAPSFKEGLRMLAEIFQKLKGVLTEKGYGTTVGDEGGFAPKVSSNEEAFELIVQAVGQTGYKIGDDIVFTPDVAASEMYEDGKYNLRREGKVLSSTELIAWYESLKQKYPIASMEDGLDENDWEGWKQLTVKIGDTTQLVGDDLLVTNVKFLERAIQEKAGNAILIKVNQIGTLIETIRAVDMAHAAGWKAMMSHRSGETEDTTIAHLAVGLGTGQIKTGSVARTDRTAKYNELLRIEELLGSKATYAGKKALGL